MAGIRFMEGRRRRKPLTKDQLLGIANYLTYGRIAIVPLIVLLMMGINDSNLARLETSKILSWVTMFLVTLSGVSDAIDGYYARKFGIVSSFGKFLDPLADKLISISVLIMLVSLGRIPAWLVVLLIARDVTITALRSMASGEGVEIAASEWGKKKTFLQHFAMGFLLVHYPLWGIDPHAIGMVLLWLTLLISLGSGIHYVWAFFSEVLERKKTSPRPPPL